MPKFQFELTDTYGGQANYSWVKRVVVDLPESTSDKMLCMLAREWAGLTGKRCEVTGSGGSDAIGSDDITIRPRGMCQVLFVTLVDGNETFAALHELVRWVENIGVEKNPALAGADLRPLENARKALQ